MVVLVTHDKTLAKHYSDRIIDIKDGQIINDRVNDNDDSYYLPFMNTLRQLQKDNIIEQMEMKKIFE